MSDHREAVDIGAHEVAMAKYNLGTAGRLLERLEEALAIATAVANMNLEPGVERVLTPEQWEAAKKRAARYEVAEECGRIYVRAKEETA